ncbi:PH domain-containing protein [Xylanimonas ulmi]|uniref:PH (Pleckstrin Homology) domain-containing protein n=1 Tax=Xylanimonas ulmi TaxID=228973 RepID=A0A4Q7M2R5_9MICO|nr:PH domain-containing protein [Xylanibacterium ulmi]RZS61774.1 PH (Pleckstrin Homology) domain-containing protein [Xylanibacterium ulmi]
MVSGEVVEYRPGFGRVLAVATGVVGAAAVIAGLVSDAAATAPFVAPVALVVLWVWAAYWRPAVVVSPAGVELRNVTRTVELPWPTIERVETKFALTLHTAYGDYAAWAAPAPGRARVTTAGKDAVANLPSSTYDGGTIRAGDLATTASGQAAMIVRARWEELRDAGVLDDPRVERTTPRVRWHVATLAAMALLLAASVVTLLVR